MQTSGDDPMAFHVSFVIISLDNVSYSFFCQLKGVVKANATRRKTPLSLLLVNKKMKQTHAGLCS